MLVQVVGSEQWCWNDQACVEGVKVETFKTGFIFGGGLMLLHPDCQTRPTNENVIISER